MGFRVRGPELPLGLFRVGYSDNVGFRAKAVEWLVSRHGVPGLGFRV